MSFTPQLLGKSIGTNITSLSVSTSGVFAAGGRIYGIVAMSNLGYDDIVDSAGNIYRQVAGSQGATISAWLVDCVNNLRLPNNSTITVSTATPWSGAMGMFGVSGLVNGELGGVSAGQGHDTTPGAALENVPVNYWALGVLGVRAPSTNTFTQAPGFSNPGNFNTQTTTEFSTYAGFRQATGGRIVFAPTIASSAEWVALLITISP